MITQKRAIEIYEQCKSLAIGSPWSDQLRNVATDDEYECLKTLLRQSHVRPSGLFTIAGKLMDVANGFLLAAPGSITILANGHHVCPDGYTLEWCLQQTRCETVDTLADLVSSGF